jgi:hypothetical protein
LEPASDNATVRTFQWGIKKVLLLLLKETLEKTEEHEEEFVGANGGPETLN